MVEERGWWKDRQVADVQRSEGRVDVNADRAGTHTAKWDLCADSGIFLFFLK
jgi:hypothetical protein